MFLVPRVVLAATFDHFRRCGCGCHECQVVWTSSWSRTEEITGVEHPEHRAHAGGFQVDSGWLNDFWLRLHQRNEGVRVQCHTHPGAAFHSTTDDDYPMIHQPGFLSLVIPRFAKGPVGFQGAFLAEMGADGRFREVPIRSHLQVMP